MRQGYPLSPYLLLLCVEIVNLYIYNRRNLKGFVIEGRETRLIQYADNTTFMVDGNKDSLDEVLWIYMFSKFPLVLQLTMRSVIFSLSAPALRKKKTDFTNDFVFNVTLDPVTMLGITFANDGDDPFRLTFIPKLSRLKSRLSVWSSRDLISVGGGVIVKTLAFSQLVYFSLVLPNPP